jgi:hypothetical protein
MSLDPKHITKKLLANPQDFNLYAYVVNNPLGNVDPDGRDWKQALSELFKATHVKFSAGFGKASKEEALGFGKKASAQVKFTIDVSMSEGVKLSTSAEAGITRKMLGFEAGPQGSKPLATMTMDPQGHVTGELGGAVQVTGVKSPTGTSSSTNGKSSELTIAGMEENIVVPAEGVPVPTPFTAGVETSVESKGLINAILALFDVKDDKEKEEERKRKEQQSCQPAQHPCALPMSPPQPK